MCCALNFDVDVDFSKTIIYGAETIHPELNRIVHVLGYQNTVQNNIKKQNSVNSSSLMKTLSNYFSFTEAAVGQGNAMLLPFPAKPGTMSSKNVIDTEYFPDILTDISSATMRGKPDLNPEPIATSFASSASSTVEIFAAAGIYTVVLAQNIMDIPTALHQVPIEKRPNPNPAIFKAYAKWYPNWTFALCCFNNDDKKEAHPMLWWYEPMFEDKLFLPALDSHDGSVPKLDQKVIIDHFLAVGSTLSDKTKFEFCYNYSCVENWKRDGLFGNRIEEFLANPNFELKISVNGNYYEKPHNLQFCPYCHQMLTRRGGENTTYQKVNYRPNNPISNELKPFLMDQVIGEQFGGQMENGDFFCSINEVREGVFNPMRRPPEIV